MKRITFKVLFFLKKDKQKSNGMITLYYRITVDGQEVRFGMKCDVSPKCWDVKTSKATVRTAEAVRTNALIDNTKAAIYRIYRELQERDNYVTAEKVKNVFLGIEQKHQTLLELFDYHNRERKDLIGVNICQYATADCQIRTNCTSCPNFYQGGTVKGTSLSAFGIFLSFPSDIQATKKPHKSLNLYNLAYF